MIFSCSFRNVVLLRTLPASFPNLSGKVWVFANLPDESGQRFGISGREEEAGAGDEITHAFYIAGDKRLSGGHSFQDGERHSFMAGGKDDDVRCGQEGGNIGPDTEKMDLAVFCQGLAVLKDALVFGCFGTTSQE